MPAFCDVALAVPLRRAFTYSIPAALHDVLLPGCRVVVRFGRRALVGVVTVVHDRPPASEKVRPVTDVLDPLPALTPALLQLGEWLAAYYLAPIGEVFRAMLPPAVEIRQQREVFLTAAGHAELAALRGLAAPSAKQQLDLAVLAALAEAASPLRESQLKRKYPMDALARLQRALFIVAQESAPHKKARTRTIVAWAARENAAASPAGSPAEARLRMVLQAECGPLPLPQALGLAKVSRSVVERLLRTGILQSWEEPLAFEHDLFEAEFVPPRNVLNESQQRVFAEIVGWLDARSFAAALLYGVTGSGKTEVYLRAVEHTLAAGRTALLLVPEIALTLWTARLCRARFGDTVAVLHSTLPDTERSHDWWRVRRGEARIVIGTRSAVFAPLENLGLVVVDEEQESAYKQEETPRYHGRDVAVVRAQREGALALLASATPSLETFHNARSGKYHLLHMDARVENRSLAPVEIVDLREDFRRTQRAGPLSAALRNAMQSSLAAGQQALVLINRRGYSWFLLCRSCGAALQCENCTISLTYHKQRARLACHYCGFSRPVPKTCPKCESKFLYFVGEGSEQVEELLRKVYPAARIGRLDRDAVRSKREFQQILSAFAAGQLDILVGTQMLAKGHDFQRVTVAGVVAADLLLGMPDFRAAERTFQLLTQLAGRAGRGALPGRVLVQTYYPEHYAIALAARQDYTAFYEKEAHFRKMMSYPPFTALAAVLVRDARIENALRWSRLLANFLTRHEKEGIRVLGPAPAPLARVRREFRFQFLLKSPRRGVLSRVLAAALDFCHVKQIPETAVLLDVDPLSFM
jgi:primosomal protein N' (replication factor Y)